MTIDEGYIKFSYDWQEKPTPIEINLSEIIAARKNLWQKGLIGVYPDGIGFGNVSIRTSNNQFLISATQIGHIELLQKEDFSLVTEYDFSKNWLRCIGSKKASSESLTHAAIYECAASIECVLHIHSKVYWQRLLGFLPSTDKSIPYGTPEMAKAVKELYVSSTLPKDKFLVMGGHEEGIISFGESPHEALSNIYRNIII